MAITDNRATCAFVLSCIEVCGLPRALVFKTMKRSSSGCVKELHGMVQWQIREAELVCEFTGRGKNSRKLVTVVCLLIWPTYQRSYSKEAIKVHNLFLYFSETQLIVMNQIWTRRRDTHILSLCVFLTDIAFYIRQRWTSRNLLTSICLRTDLRIITFLSFLQHQRNSVHYKLQLLKAGLAFFEWLQLAKILTFQCVINEDLGWSMILW